LFLLQVWKHFDRAAIVAKRELQYTGTFGLGIKLCGTVFVDRGSSEAGRAAINAAGKRARESGTRCLTYQKLQILVYTYCNLQIFVTFTIFV
jgi:1-acyl-sn-glycerol-3-phosphate acyltransferase